MNYIINILSLAGCIGLFLYGMKLMSESLQRISGNKLRSFTKYIASSRIKAVFSGLFITALLQASAVVSVITLSFVNVGMLSLSESIGILLGANIGTTIKIWLLSFIGFNSEMGLIALPIMGIALPFLFSKKEIRKNWSEFVFGFALLFFSLDLLNYFFDQTNANSALMNMLGGLYSNSFSAILIFLLAGIIITALVRSSSAIIALTLVMCANQWISFELGVATILGANIGTSITANIAALGANVHSKRMAISHTLIKVIGVIWVLLIFQWFIQATDYLTRQIINESPLSNASAAPLGLAVFHTFFNIANAILLLGAIPWLTKIAEKLIPAKNKKDELFGLKYINSPFSSSEIVLQEAEKEIVNLAKSCRKQFSRIPDLLNEKDENTYENLFKTIKEQEEIIDKIEDEINAYLNQTYRGKYSEKGLKRVKSMQRIIKELENVGDLVYHMAKSINRKNVQRAWFTNEQRDNLKGMYALLYSSFEVLIENLEKDYDKVAIDKAQMLELQINKLRSDLVKEQFEIPNTPDTNYKGMIIYADLIYASEKLADHIFNINEAIMGLK